MQSIISFTHKVWGVIIFSVFELPTQLQLMQNEIKENNLPHPTLSIENLHTPFMTEEGIIYAVNGVDPSIVSNEGYPCCSSVST